MINAKGQNSFRLGKNRNKELSLASVSQNHNSSAAAGTLAVGFEFGVQCQTLLTFLRCVGCS